MQMLHWIFCRSVDAFFFSFLFIQISRRQPSCHFIPALITSWTTIKFLILFLVKDVSQNIYKLAFLPLATIMVLPIALLIKAPDPLSNWSRVTTQGDGPVWSWTSIENKPLAKSYIELSKSETINIGIMGTDGNAIAVVTGAKNVLLVNVLADLGMSAEIKKQSAVTWR